VRTSLVVAFVAIALLGVASFAINAAGSRDGAERVEAVSPGTAGSPPAPTIAPSPAEPRSRPVDLPAVAGTLPDPWASVVPVDRADEMAEVGPAFARALSESFAALGRCFEQSNAPNDPARGAGAANHGGAEGTERGPSVLLLELETTAGGAHIVDAPVGLRGATRDEVIRCAQGVFRGMQLDAPGAIPGKRYRMRYALVQ
jgi:hypothetical protein